MFDFKCNSKELVNLKHSVIISHIEVNNYSHDVSKKGVKKDPAANLVFDITEKNIEKNNKTEKNMHWILLRFIPIVVVLW